METGAIQKLENLLLVSVPRDLMDEEVLRLRRQVSQEVRKHHSRWVLLDFSQVDICDSFFGRFIQSMAEMAGLMGADVIVSGLQDAVVETLVELGMTLPNIHAVLDLDDALAMSRDNAPGNGQELNGHSSENLNNDNNLSLTDFDFGESLLSGMTEV
jgi:rsbT antagonist protein RsbS